MRMDVYLREAQIQDRDLLFQWANDALVRQNAFHTEQIPYENHIKWYDNMMQNPFVYQYILCDGELPVGQLRLDIKKTTAVIDYSIAQNKRGLGLGYQIIMLAKEKVASEITSVTELIGQVKYGNTASEKVFEKCGFHRTEKAEYIEFAWSTKGAEYEDHNCNN